jgi:hypothetical protein
MLKESSENRSPFRKCLLVLYFLLKAKHGRQNIKKIKRFPREQGSVVNIALL